MLKINVYFWKVFQSFGVECENDANDCVVTQLFSIHLGHLKGESELEAWAAARGSSESWNLLSYYVQNVPKLGRWGRGRHIVVGQIFGIKSPNNVKLKQEAGERTVGEIEGRRGGEN